MSTNPHLDELSRRERQIMDIVYKLGKATAAEITEKIPGSPRNATVRKLLSILIDKGFLQYERDGNLYNRYIYSPTIPADKARKSAMDHLLDTFFQGSAARAVITLMKESDSELTSEEKEMISLFIKQSEKEGR